MPRCKEGYRSKRVDEFMRSCRNCSILDVAQSINESISGSSDGLSDEAYDEAIHALRFYRKHWTKSRNLYDLAVYFLIEQALVLAEWNPRSK